MPSASTVPRWPIARGIYAQHVGIKVILVGKPNASVAVDRPQEEQKTQGNAT